MKVVHMLPLFNPRAKGGMETFSAELAKAQAAWGDDVHLLCPNVAEEAAREELDGLPLVRFPFPYGIHDPAFLAGRRRHPTCDALRDAVEAIDPDVLHLHGLYPYMLPYLESVQHASHRKMVLTVHLANVLCARQNLVNWRGEFCDGRVDFETCARCVGSGQGVGRLKATVSRVLLPVSAALARTQVGAGTLRLIPAHGRVEAQVRALDFMRAHCFMDLLNSWFRDVFLRNGFPENQVSYFRSPTIDPDAFVGSKVTRSAAARLQLLYVGRISKDKGIDTLLEALCGVGDGIRRYTLTLVGKCDDPRLKAWIRGLVQKGHEIELAGEVSRDEVREHYAGSDYLLFPGSIDMMPLAIQEALENELPVIASDRPSSKAVVREGLNGYLFNAGDAADLGRVLKRILNEGTVLEFQYRPEVGVEQAKVEYYRRLYERVVSTSHEPS